ncbi:glutamine cyclotransferase [Alteromonadaceae bacterium 2753L.S.0a.02]|nr:glutamine cyclotransferase [Alteromonadaceae bacterium 2753L.S.0a.02]
MLSKIKFLISLAVLLPALVYATPEKLQYKILSKQDHDERLFTQGFVMHAGDLFESSGLYGKSFLRRYNPDNGKIVSERELPAEIFAEGLSYFNDRLYLLTWRHGILFILDPETLKVKHTQKYRGEGWGITHNNEHFFTSDGSSFITVRDPNSFEKLNTLQVVSGTQAINWINELEFARGFIWANRWQSHMIYRVDPASGEVTGELDLSALVPTQYQNSHERVLNGIAYVSDKDAFWVTGKNWPVRYLLQISSSQPQPR